MNWLADLQSNTLLFRQLRFVCVYVCEFCVNVCHVHADTCRGQKKGPYLLVLPNLQAICEPYNVDARN